MTPTSTLISVLANGSPVLTTRATPAVIVTIRRLSHPLARQERAQPRQLALRTATSRPTTDGDLGLTPGITLRPWNQPWQVCFVPCWQHWTMRPFRMPPPFQHVFLLGPTSASRSPQSRWLYVEWSFMGAVAVLIDEAQATPLHQRVSARGRHAVLPGDNDLPPPHMANGLWPLTCVTFVRQVLGLPFRYRMWTPKALWDELLEGGARIVVSPPQE